MKSLFPPKLPALENFVPDLDTEHKLGARATPCIYLDIIYLIDATGSMTSEINAAKEQVINVLKELQSKYPTINLIFRAIFYR